MYSDNKPRLRHDVVKAEDVRVGEHIADSYGVVRRVINRDMVVGGIRHYILRPPVPGMLMVAYHRDGEDVTIYPRPTYPEVGR